MTSLILICRSWDRSISWVSEIGWCDDPVAVIATNTQLQIGLTEEVEVIMVVDRSERSGVVTSHFTVSNA